MRGKNNGDPQVCVNNLMAITRGEVAYDRIRGIGTEPIDGTIASSSADIAQDAKWVINTYEPRGEVDGIEVVADEASDGGFKVKVGIR